MCEEKKKETNKQLKQQNVHFISTIYIHPVVWNYYYGMADLNGIWVILCIRYDEFASILLLLLFTGKQSN